MRRQDDITRLYLCEISRLLHHMTELLPYSLSHQPTSAATAASSVTILSHLFVGLILILIYYCAPSPVSPQCLIVYNLSHGNRWPPGECACIVRSLIVLRRARCFTVRQLDDTPPLFYPDAAVAECESLVDV